MSFRLFLAKGSKPIMALTGIGMSMYGTYEWNKTKKALKIDDTMSMKDMEAMFHEIDRDKSGYIDERELMKYLKERKVEGIGPYEVHAMMVSADESKDGKISFAEWKDLIKGTHEASHPGQKMVPAPGRGSAPKVKVDTHAVGDRAK
jgi:hypothetical protein